ncbi:MAG TPA: hypothetical protein VKA89_00535 [Solirubrobacterales bacterium]|nr:hypothetical protein [Solirubrobacterales bacterium]
MAGRRRATSLMLAAGLVAAAIALAGCGGEETTSVVEGEPVELGSLEYNVLFSRFLNPDDTEDKAYLEGQPAPGQDTIYFGIFAQVENHDSEESQTLPGTFTIVDADENEFEAVESESPYALPLGEEIPPKGEIPAPDSVPAVGPIEGSLLIFEITESSTENRPLTLLIDGEDGPAEVELDL